MLAGDTGLNGSFDATEVGWLAQYASDYDGPGIRSLIGRMRVVSLSVLTATSAVWIQVLFIYLLGTYDSLRTAQ